MSDVGLRHSTAKGITLVYAQILPVMAIASLFPAIPRLFAHFGGMPYGNLLVPMIVTVPALFVALTAPFAGMLADRFGRRRTFVGGMILYVVAGLVPLLTADLYAIVGSRMVLGVAEAFVVTVSSALIGDYYGEQRHKWVAQVGIWITIIGALLLVAGGALADISWRGPFAIYLAVIPGAIMAWLYIEEPSETATRVDNEPGAPFPWRAAWLIGSVTLVTSLIYYVEPLNYAAVVTLLGVKLGATIGLTQAFTTVGYITGAFVYRRLHAWPVTLHLGFAGLAIGLGVGIMGVTHTFTAAIIGGIVQQFGAGLVIPALMAWAQNLLPIAQRGRGMGIWVTTFFTGMFLCPPMITGLSVLGGGLQPALAAIGLIAIVLALITFAVGMRQRQSRLSSL
ncbi:MFS transporter [Novosphingobium sp.]|uniref:MFS transporter n=1 Tax=Novosphingobium sp. TaxID=1874826 RepID=UPI003D13A2B6